MAVSLNAPKKIKLALGAVLLALSISLLVGTIFVKYGSANPYFPGEETAPPAGAKPPTIIIRSPEDKTYATSSIQLAFNVTAGETQPIPTGVYTTAVNTRISEVYYEADWLSNNVTVYLPATDKYGSYIDNGAYTRTSVEFSDNLSNIPQGRHSIVIYATESGVYEGGPVSSGSAYVYQNRFNIRQSWVVAFTLGAAASGTIVTRPVVSLLSIANATYAQSDVPLNFALSEPVSQITYSLDGQDNVTISGNATLTGLSNGEHNVTIYGCAADGYVGSSGTVFFTVAKPESSEPFPTVIVVAASVAAVVVVSASLLGYVKRRNRKQGLAEGMPAQD
jgi:hypothetical protein